MRTELVGAGVMLGLAGLALAQPKDVQPPRDSLMCVLPPQDVPEGLWNANLWPGGIIPYTVDAAVTQQNRDRLRAAMDELESVCGVRFVPRTNQTNYVNVRNGTSNSSSVGMIGGQQTLTMVSWHVHYIIVHELMHAMGVWHEQQRADRDQYVFINFANMQSGYEGNFTIRPNASPHGPFDFESVMMYDDCSFSLCCAAGSTCGCPFSCATIQALPAYSQYQNVMGNRSYMGQGDRNSLVSRYGQPPAACYANCDGSTGNPLLTSNDFQCFLNRFAAADPYANCDGSTGSPSLTANDFQCYLNSFAAGCT
ncbi:MAG: hypothetical protein KF678_07000 [Phycisphaeraceae bacterium]|nr:hypothetical protein [Phycisphaeraceae bacterium]